MYLTCPEEETTLESPFTVPIETELGQIFVTPTAVTGADVTAPHLTVDGMPLQASAFLVSDGGPNFDLLQTWDPKSQSFVQPSGIRARLVDGRDADIVTLGKIAAVIVPAVRRLAETNRGIFLEAERRSLNNDIRKLENDSERLKAKIEEKKQSLAAIVALLR